MEYHIEKDGKKIKLTDLETNYLEQIIQDIEQKAKEGFIENDSPGGYLVVHYDQAAKLRLNYYYYKQELKRRKE